MTNFFDELDKFLGESTASLHFTKRNFLDALNKFLGKSTAALKSIKGKKKLPPKAISEKPGFETKAIERKSVKKRTKKFELLPSRVGRFDELLSDGGLERGSTTLISGGAGTGKTTFCIQSLYWGAMHGEKGVFISFEEEPEKIKEHMLKNYGWNLQKLEEKGLIAIVKFDPGLIARKVEGVLAKKAGTLRIETRKILLPLKPDRIALDSLSALSIAFENEEKYRKYLRELFELLEDYNSVNFAISETEQNPKIYSRTGVEEFLADGLIVFYNLKVDGRRKKALEILKMRSGKHVQEMIPYKIAEKGIEIMIDSKTRPFKASKKTRHKR